MSKFVFGSVKDMEDLLDIVVFGAKVHSSAHFLGSEELICLVSNALL